MITIKLTIINSIYEFQTLGKYWTIYEPKTPLDSWKTHRKTEGCNQRRDTNWEVLGSNQIPLCPTDQTGNSTQQKLEDQSWVIFGYAMLCFWLD